MKKLIAFALLLTLLFTASCQKGSWKGFYDEDLSAYVTVGEYKGMIYYKPDINISREAINNEIAVLLEAASELVESDKSAKEFSAVTIDRYCFLNGVSTPELSVEDQTYYIGTEYDDVVIDTIAAACVGKNKGDTFTVTLKLPAGYKGIVNVESSVEYRVTVLSVYEKITPELTDNIASVLMPGCKSISELESAIMARIEKQYLDSHIDEQCAIMKNNLISSSNVKKIPVSVLNEYYEDGMTLYKRLAAALNMSVEEYAEKELAMTASELENMVAKTANARTKEALVLYSIVKAENIVVTDDSLIQFAEKMAQSSEGIFKTGEEYLTYYGKNAVTEDYLWSQVLDIMLENAIVQ